MIGETRNGSHFLYTIDRTTGVATAVGAGSLLRGDTNIGGLAWDGTDFYFVGGSPRRHKGLYRLTIDFNAGTRRWFQVGTVREFGVGVSYPDSLEWDGSDLYMTCLLYTSPSPRD